MKTSGQIHWDYMLLLEKDLADIFEYIEPCPENTDTFGPKTVKLLLAVGAEVDATFKDLAKIVDPSCGSATKKRPTIEDHCEMAQMHLQSEFDRVEVQFAGSDLVYEPWSSWWKDDAMVRVANGKEAPGWWSAYNKVKHRRADSYDKATLGNLLAAFSGLFVVCASLLRRDSACAFPRSTQIVDYSNASFGRPSITEFEAGLMTIHAVPFYDAKVLRRE